MNPRFYVDESLLGLGKALAHARADVVYPGHPALPTLQLGDLDEDWIPKVAAAGLVAIVRDRHVFTRWWENELIVTNKLRLIHLAVKRNLSNWGYLVLLVRHWESIERHVSNSPDGPWRIRILERLTELQPVTLAKQTGPRPTKRGH